MAYFVLFLLFLIETSGFPVYPMFFVPFDNLVISIDILNLVSVHRKSRRMLVFNEISSIFPDNKPLEVKKFRKPPPKWLSDSVTNPGFTIEN